MTKVTSAESLFVRVRKELHERGFVLDKDMGPSCGNRFIRIRLYCTLPVPHRFLFWKYETNELHLIADLYLSNEKVGATEKNWIIHVYGRALKDEFLTLADALSDIFTPNVIHVRLEREEPELVLPAHYD